MGFEDCVVSSLIAFTLDLIAFLKKKLENISEVKFPSIGIFTFCADNAVHFGVLLGTALARR